MLLVSVWELYLIRLTL